MTDPTKFKAGKSLSQQGMLMSMARVPQSTRMFAGCSDALIYEVDWSVEKPEWKAFPKGHESYVTGLSLVGKQLISGAYDGRLCWWDVEKKELLRTVDAHTRWIRGVVATPDGKTIISVSDDMLTKLWNAETGELMQSLSNHQAITPHHYPSMLYAVTVSPCGKFLATGDRVGHVVISELAGGTKVAELETPVMYTWDPTARRHSIGGIRSLAFSPDSKHLAVGGMGKVGNIDHLEGVTRIEIFDWAAGQRTHELAGSKTKGLIERLVFHPENQWLVAAGGDHKGLILFYDLTTNQQLHQLDGSAHMHSIELDESATTLYGVGYGRAAVWKVEA